MVAKNGSKKVNVGTFQKKYVNINAVGDILRYGTHGTNSIKLIKVNGKLVLP